ncbi:hypothetical protein PFNF54_02901 [Plasmodium falciparum NF54]|uniref:Uncharacterized protein n=1 Tax=Plasmodium falciparum (isolate NF54) TaxID=5843 RepID=W7K5V5_PLAFO|nr:hypothetical protein PFNF54_02901 [Plasmodium falciparum NF54]
MLSADTNLYILKYTFVRNQRVVNFFFFFFLKKKKKKKKKNKFFF